MAANALIQTRIDSDIKARAAAVLEKSGLSISDAVRILLTRTANEGVVPMDLCSSPLDDLDFIKWAREKIQEERDSPSPRISNDKVKAIFEQKRDALKAQHNLK